MSLLLLPETWVLLALTASAFLYRQAPWMAVAGLLCYALSYAFSTAWHFAPDGWAVAFWQSGMVAVLAMYVVVASYIGVQRAWWVLAAALPLALQFFGVDRHILEFIVKAGIAIAVYLTFARISINETIAKMVWVAILMAEGWAVIEKSCPYLPQPYEAASQCGRVAGPYEPFMVTGAIAVGLVGIGILWLKTRTPRT